MGLEETGVRQSERADNIAMNRPTSRRDELGVKARKRESERYRKRSW